MVALPGRVEVMVPVTLEVTHIPGRRLLSIPRGPFVLCSPGGHCSGLLPQRSFACACSHRGCSGLVTWCWLAWACSRGRWLRHAPEEVAGSDLLPQRSILTFSHALFFSWMVAITGMSSKTLNTRVKNKPLCLLLMLHGKHPGSPTPQATCWVLGAGDWTQGLMQFSMWAPELYPSMWAPELHPNPLRFGKYSLSEWRHCFLLHWLLTIHLVNVWCILTWLTGHDGACTELQYLEVKVGGSEVHRQPGCYIRAVSKGQRTTKKETVYIYTHGLFCCYCVRVVGCIDWFPGYGAHWYFYFDLILYFTHGLLFLSKGRILYFGLWGQD